MSYNNLSFSIWLISLNMIPSRSMPHCCKWQHFILFYGWVVVHCVCVCVCVCVCIIFFVHSPIDGHKLLPYLGTVKWPGPNRITQTSRGPRTLFVRSSTDLFLCLTTKLYDAPCTARYGKQNTTSIGLFSMSLHSRVSRTSNLTLTMLTRE